MILHGDCLELLPTLEENLIDAIVTDPPYNLTPAGSKSKGGFMGLAWDSTGIAFNVDMWKECLRVLKPGGYMLAFGGTRTYHRMVCAIEDAGFEIRDQIDWLYGSGMPKSLNVGKQIDKRGGVSVSWFGAWLREERQKRGIAQKELALHFPSKTGGLTGCVANWELGLNLPTPKQFNVLCDVLDLPFNRIEEAEREIVGHNNRPAGWFTSQDGHDITLPSTPKAKYWDGWGTALKPAHEPICLARKPLSEPTIAENVLKWGTGAINIEACRIGMEIIAAHGGGINVEGRKYGMGKGLPAIEKGSNPHQGRWPANVLFDEPAAALLDLQSGYSKSTKRPPTGKALFTTNESDRAVKWNPNNVIDNTERGHNDSGGASRYFMVIRSDDVSGNISGKMRDDGTSNGESLVHVQSTPKDVLHGCGNKTMAASQKDLKFTTSMATKPTTGLKTSLFSEDMNTGCCTDDGERIMLSSTGSSIESAKSADNTNLSANSIGEVQVLIRDTARPVQETNLQSGDTRIENIGMPITENTEGTSPSFFYVAKASKKERGEGNDHPTVKPLQLIRYLVRLVTPPNGKVLDPFAGSGTTGLACQTEGFSYILIERDPHFIDIIHRRLDISPR